MLKPPASHSERIRKECRRLGRRLRKLFWGSEGNNVWNDSANHVCPDGFKVNWVLLDEVRRFQQKEISGQAGTTREAFIVEQLNKIGRRELKALCIGALEIAPPELGFIQSGLFREIVVCDIARDLLKRQQARADAEKLSIKYVHKDLNIAELEQNAFDLIYAVGTIHHIEKLDHLFAQIKLALKPDGLFAMDEFVGPTQFQWSMAQVSLANGFLEALPEAYRVRSDGRLKKQIVRPRVKDVVRVDPSEAIRSLEILPTLSKYLEVTQTVELGGAMLHLLLEGIAGNFEGDEEGRALLCALLAMDALLVKRKILHNDFVFLVARPRASCLTPPERLGPT